MSQRGPAGNLAPVLYGGQGNYYTDAGERLALVQQTTGVSSVSGTANQITASPTTGAVILSLPSAVILPGSLTSTGNITSGGALGTTGGGIISENGNRVLTGLTAGSGIAITGTAPNLTVSVSGGSGGAVTSVSGTSGQIVASPTSGAVVLSLASAVTFPGTITVSSGNAATFSGPVTFTTSVSDVVVQAGRQLSNLGNMYVGGTSTFDGNIQTNLNVLHTNGSVTIDPSATFVTNFGSTAAFQGATNFQSTTRLQTNAGSFTFEDSSIGSGNTSVTIYPGVNWRRLYNEVSTNLTTVTANGRLVKINFADATWNYTTDNPVEITINNSAITLTSSVARATVCGIPSLPNAIPALTTNNVGIGSMELWIYGAGLTGPNAAVSVLIEVMD